MQRLQCLMLCLAYAWAAPGGAAQPVVPASTGAALPKTPGANPLRAPLAPARQNPFAPVAPKAAPVPAAPVAAPLPLTPVVLSEPAEQAPPFRFLMRYRDADDRMVVYLEKGNDILRAEPGKPLDGAFKTDRIEATQVVLVNTDTHVEVSIRIPGATN